MNTRFELQDFFSKEFYERWGENSRWFLDYRIPYAAQEVENILKEEFGNDVTIIINTWNQGGSRNHSGYRPPDSPYHRPFSQHSFGRAFDFQVLKNNHYLDIKLVYDVLMDKKYLQRIRETGITTIEDIKFTYRPKTRDRSSGWIHFDMRWTGQMELLVVKP